MTDPGDDRWIEQWLSRPRFAVYVAAAHGDRPRALALYEWNFTVAAAFHHDLGHLEIGLRNAYDGALSSRDRPGDRHWVFEPFRHFPFHEQRAKNGRPFDVNASQRDHIERAIKAAQRGAGNRAFLPGPSQSCDQRQRPPTPRNGWVVVTIRAVSGSVLRLHRQDGNRAIEEQPLADAAE